jgi:hypothetical protein
LLLRDKVVFEFSIFEVPQRYWYLSGFLKDYKLAKCVHPKFWVCTFVSSIFLPFTSPSMHKEMEKRIEKRAEAILAIKKKHYG